MEPFNATENHVLSRLEAVVAQTRPEREDAGSEWKGTQ
jgi:hypothetical protein